MANLRRLFRPFAYLFVCLACSQAADLPSASGLEGKAVQAVQFDPPKQPLTPEQLASIVGFKYNAALGGDELRTAIKKLYKTGRYSNVEVEAEPAGAGVTLIFRTEEQWFIGPVEVGGNTKYPPNRGQLANATRLELGQPYTADSLSTALDGLQRLLQRDGFFEATIQPKEQRDPDHQEISLTFLVDAGKRARLTTPIITGDPKLPAEKVASETKYKGWFRWKQDTEENVQSGLERVRNKYVSQDRLTATTTLEDMRYDKQTRRAQPTLKVNGGPKVKFTTDGAKVSKGKLKKYVPVFDEGTVNRDLVVEGARNLRDYFQYQGYYEAEVDFETKDEGPDQQRITYVINLGPRHKLVQVLIKGNKYFKTADLRDRMFLQPAGFIRFRHGRYSAAFERRDADAITALYRANGFRDVKVLFQVIDDYHGKTGDVAATVVIEEGPQYVVSAFSMSGVKQLKPEDLAGLTTTEGQPYSENNVAMDRDYIITRYQSAGFPDATFDYKETPGPGPHQFKVQYFITEGKRRYVRDVVLTGMKTTKMRVVKPNVMMEAGDPLSWTQMGIMQRRLYELGVFDKVDMAIQNPDGDTDRKYVLYHLDEGHRYQMAVGIGAEVARIGGSQTSLSNAAGQTGFAPRASFEISRLNMFGLGHSLNFKSRYSTLQRLGSLNYYAPRYHNVDGRNLSFTALYDDTRDVRTFTAKRLEGSAQVSQKFTKAVTGLFRYTWRDVRVDSSTLKISPLLIPQLSQPAQVASVGSSLIQDRRDDPSNAHRGIYNSLDLALAERIFGGQKNFVHFLARNSYYKTIRKTMVLASNTEFGWLGPFHVPKGTDPTEYIPLPERFYGGGSTTMRGFPDNQAGPRDAYTGFPVGGNALFFHATELRFPLIGDNIDGVIFHDMGNIYSSISKISFRVSQKSLTDFDYMVHAAGFGIRYRTPVGPIRLDLAYSINPPSFMGLKGTYDQLLFNVPTPPQRVLQSVSHFQFFFSIGQSF